MSRKHARVSASVVDITPTWAAMLPVLLELLSVKDRPARDAAVAELKNMARAADMYNQMVNKA